MEITTLENAIVRLEPLHPDHAAGLAAAASGPRDSYEWTAVPTPESAEATIAAALSRPEFWPFAQVDVATGGIVGHTAYLSPRYWPDGRLLAIEIGATWLHPAAQGTGLNAAAKLLLLEHAFAVLRVARVDIKTDARNARARASILTLGAVFEGVLRSWQPSGAPGEHGLTRDTAMYAVTHDDWANVRARLGARVASASA